MQTFDKQLAKQARDGALVAVDDAADAEWKEHARRAIALVCVNNNDFTTDAIWHVLDGWKVPPPIEPRALGPLMMRAVRLRQCRPTGRFSRSVRVACHRRPLPVYASLIVTSTTPLGGPL